MLVNGGISGNNHNVLQDSNDSKPQTGIFTQNGLNVVNLTETTSLGVIIPTF